MNTKPSLKSVDISIPMPWGPIAGRTYGDATGMPVLCVHGRSDNLEAFGHLLPLLPRNHYFVFIDMPGHGKSAHAAKGYILDLQWYTLCVKRVIDHFDWPKLCFIGHSLGGHIGFMLASLYPELISKLVILEALMQFHVLPQSGAGAIRNNVIDVIFKLEKRMASEAAPIYSQNEFIKRMRESRATEASEEEIRCLAERNLVKVGTDQYKYGNDQRTKFLSYTYFAEDFLKRMAAEISCPTLIILGTKSFTRPLENVNCVLENKIKNVTFKIIDGDHDIHLARPREVARLVNPFLAGETISKL